MAKMKKSDSALKEALEDLAAARDEARLQLHLLSMEAREKWSDLEAELEGLDPHSPERTDKAADRFVTLVRELARSVRTFVREHVDQGPTAPVGTLMKTDVRTCAPSDPLNSAAQIMWESDCGIVPVVSEAGALVGVLTDRDICMAAYTQGRPLWACSVGHAMSEQVYSCSPDDTIEKAAGIMAERQVRRLPVTAPSGRLLGILSLADIARQVKALGISSPRWCSLLATTLGAISEQGIASQDPARAAAE